ncbi:MAG: hypothetical protein GY724_11910 [Actinomycetia bacterium]|nr:hypothetical protein [Actinomycetes bacterium]MCP5033530.1 hypothetical protein [Actinomycetes bacterium]
MSTLAHVLEEEGLATISLGIIEEQLRSTAPPRGLFVDFPLGRPLGRPADPSFQQHVLDHAFSLLEATEPMIEVFPEAIHDDGQVLACSIPPIDDPDAHPAVAEARGLRAAYNRTMAVTGGRVGAHRVVDPDDIPAAIESFIRVAEGTPWKEAGIPGIPARVAQDIRGYYEAAAMALADHGSPRDSFPAAFEATRWFLRETEGGKAILAARDKMRDNGVKQPIWYFLVTEQY